MRVLAIALTALVVVPAAASASQAEQLHKSRSVVRFFTEGHSWMPAPNQERCRSVPWERTCWIARQKLSFHQGRLERLKQVMWRTLPETGDWRTSVRLSQRIYPGTESWLLYISDREGGWGPFVMNHQGSGAGG